MMTMMKGNVFNMAAVCTWNMLISKFDVDDVVSRFSRTESDLAGSIFYVLTVYVHFTGPLNGET